MQQVTHKFLEHMAAGECKRLFNVIGIEPEYNYKQLQRLEDLFKRNFYQKVKYPTTLLPFGYYLGETMVRNIEGAKWTNQEQGNVFDLEVTIFSKDGMEMRANPFMRFDKFSKDSTDAPSTFFWLFKNMAVYTYAELTAMGEPLTDGWYKFPEGHIVRLLKIQSKK